MSARRLSRLALGASLALSALSVPGLASAQDFTYAPPGQLVPGSGSGRVDDTIFAPGMRFPIEAAPAFANSQVWGTGGSQGPSGSQCAVANYSYPWHDNYCESRSWDMPLCPSGTGHQGQDIRGADCTKDVHWVVASAAGRVTNIGSYSVYVTAPDGTRYDYLHMGSVQVSLNEQVTRGQRLGKVSNEFGGTPTTVHLHFNIRQSVANVGTVYVPPYASLVASYQALLGPVAPAGEGVLDEVSCEGVRGWAAAPEQLESPIEVRLYFDGDPEGGQTVGHPVLADQNRPDLCDALGSCDHGFSTGLPLSLLDGAEHTIEVHADAGAGAPIAELEASPGSFSCNFDLPSGVRREIAGLDAKNAWRFSTFWDEIEVSDGVLGSLADGDPLDDAPGLVVSASDGSLWLVDRGVRRPIESEAVARAWDFHPALASELDADALSEIPLGKPVRARPVVLRSAEGELFLVDDADPTLGSGGGVGVGGGGEGGQGDGVSSASGSCSCLVAGARGSESAGVFAFAGLLGLAGLSRLVGRRRGVGR
jgi:murein DD-endopeptidase MepM/ murein hydrolase activator NlpD